MSATLQWAVAHLAGETMLTCGHVAATVAPLGDEVYCDQCMWGFEARLDQELALVADAAPQRELAP
jgi:hypothetical protein